MTTIKTRIKDFSEKNPGMWGFLKLLALGLAVVVALLLLNWLAYGSFWTGKQPAKEPPVVTTTPPSPVIFADTCYKCKSEDDKLLELKALAKKRYEANKVAEDLFGEKTTKSERTKVVVKYVPVKNCLSCQTTPSKKTSTPTKGEDVAQYEHMGTPSLDGVWIEVWNPIHTKCIYFPHNKGGLDAIKDFVISHHGDWENSKSNFPSRESLPDL